MYTRILKGIYFTLTQVVTVSAKGDGFQLFCREPTLTTNGGNVVTDITELERIKLELLVFESIRPRWAKQEPSDIMPENLATTLIKFDEGYAMNINHYLSFRDFGYQ